MSNIARRLRRLEEVAVGDGQMFVVFSGGASSQEIRDMLRRDHGVTVGPRDQIVHFVTIYEDENGNPAPNTTPPFYKPTHAKGRFDRRRR